LARAWPGSRDVVYMRNRSVAELDKLFEEVGTYRKSEQFRELLEFVKRFPDIAPYRASP
jgi:hypothetical protein